MILKNAKIVDGDFNLRKADIRIEGERIAEIGENLIGGDILDLTDKYVLPGFIDTHIHGAYGARVSDKGAELDKITRFEATRGVTSLALTTATSEYGFLLEQLSSVRDAAKYIKGSKIVGIHAEGPFISHKYKGAMTEKFILTPDKKAFDGMLEASGGLMKIITIAPETEGAVDLIKYAVSNGVTVSMGHTDSDYDTAMRAIEAGASRMTHTFNAARAINHREPGVLGAALTTDSVTCEMICDLVHLHFATIKMIYALKGADRISMISDSGHAAGLDVTEFEVDGVMRYVKDGVVRLANGTIAGSAMTLHDGVKNLIKGGIPLGDVSKMASLMPARAVGIDSETGSIEKGKLADLVVLDDKFNVVKTFVNGSEI